MKPLLKLLEHGQSYWLDNLTRDMIHSGELHRRVAQEGLRGVTSNPKIFDKAITHSDRYEAQIREAVSSGKSTPQIYEAVVVTDVRDACDVLRPVYEASDGVDGYVSLEVSPHLAHDAQGSIREARRLYAEVDRPNVYIKIPGTAAGVGAVEELLSEGVNVNVTLLFGVDRYRTIADAYIRALERRLERGRPLDSVASVASFFLSRMDVLVDPLLDQRIAGVTDESMAARAAQLRGRTAVANARLAYRAFEEITASERWRHLAEHGARPQRLLWASTSTKNPDYSDIMYVEPLIGPQTVNTLPAPTIRAFADHGRVADTLRQGMDEAQAVMEQVTELGIDMGQVTEQLENEGVQKFIDPYDALMDNLAAKRVRYLDRRDIGPLKAMSRRLRREVIRMTTEAGSGHATSCMSAAELVSALFFRVMRWDPGDPRARNVDRFVLSKGHAAPLLWAALSESGAIDEDPMSLRRIDSSLEGHPTPNNPWVQVATGSLGQGLAAANGIALANRLDGIDARVYCLLGDGECSEGSVWEAAQFASLHDLKNVVAIVDVNALGQSGPAPYHHHTDVFADRFRAFGWHSVQIDGHDMAQVLDACRTAARQGPTAIIARTEKGKGVSFLEGEDGWHGKALSPADMEKALAELGEADVHLRVEPRRTGGFRETASAAEPPRIRVDYERGQQAATRDGYGSALRKLGEVMPRVTALDGDVKNSTRAKAFAEAYPERFFESYIAEQNMAGAALGLAACGKIPYAASFACFLSRAYDFIRMAGHSRPEHLVFCGSHAGVSIGEDGPSQMGLEDLAMFRAVHGSTVLYPSDAVSAEHLTEEAARTPGIVYLRTTRPKTPVIYANEETFPVGGSKTLRSSGDDRFTLVAAGITVHEALVAHERLREKGIATRVIDAYSVKPLDVSTLASAAEQTEAMVVVEDHWKQGGLGDAVGSAVGCASTVHQLAVTGEPRSGREEELLDRHGISHRAIEEKVLTLAAAA